MAVHDAKESWERVRDGILLPSMPQGLKGGFPTPPQQTAIDVYKRMP